MMRETDDHISRLTGQVLGPAYLDGLLVNPASVWWSRPTSGALRGSRSGLRPGGVQGSCRRHADA